MSVAGPGPHDGVPLVGTTPEKLTVPPAGMLAGETVMLDPAENAEPGSSAGATAPPITASAMTTPARRM